MCYRYKFFFCTIRKVLNTFFIMFGGILTYQEDIEFDLKGIVSLLYCVKVFGV